MTSKTLWETYSPAMKEEAEHFCEGYKQHISSCKTERECVDAVMRAAAERGYLDISKVGALTPGLESVRRKSRKNACVGSCGNPSFRARTQYTRRSHRFPPFGSKAKSAV